MITPVQVFYSWQDNDLLGLDPPQQGESYRAYRARVDDDALAEDRLFHFTLAELCGEDIDAEEADRRLCRAVSDLEAVREGILATADEWQPREDE